MVSKKELGPQFMEAFGELSNTIKSLNSAGNAIKTNQAYLNIIPKISSLKMGNNGPSLFSADFSTLLRSMIDMSEDELAGLIRSMKEITVETKALMQGDSQSTRVCEVCYGKGDFPCGGCYESGACQVCNGKREFKVVLGVNKDGDEIIGKKPCPACKGSGLCSICHGSTRMKCTNCGGTGRTSG